MNLDEIIDRLGKLFYPCAICGGLAWDKEAHDEWHLRLREALSVAEGEL